MNSARHPGLVVGTALAAALVGAHVLTTPPPPDVLAPQYAPLPAITTASCDGIEWGSIEPTRWGELMADGWHGDPADQRETIYPPTCLTS